MNIMYVQEPVFERLPLLHWRLINQSSSPVKIELRIDHFESSSKPATTTHYENDTHEKSSIIMSLEKVQVSTESTRLRMSIDHQHKRSY